MKDARERELLTVINHVRAENLTLKEDFDMLLKRIDRMKKEIKIKDARINELRWELVRGNGLFARIKRWFRS